MLDNEFEVFISVLLRVEMCSFQFKFSSRITLPNIFNHAIKRMYS